MTVEKLVALGPEGLAEADALLDRASHDVAKYMAMTARNVEPADVSEEEVESFRGDLLRTDGERPAWELWAPLSQALMVLAADPELDAVDRGMAELKSLSGRLGAGREELAELFATTRTVADRITGLRRAVRRRLIEVAG